MTSEPSSPPPESPDSPRTTLLFSDVHLQVAERDRESVQEFVAFLRWIAPSRVDRVIILGDLFDFWFEYRHVVFSGYFDVLRAFADLRDAGVEFHFICGNHDFWAGRFLEQQLGFRIHRHDATFDFGPQKVLLAHGDGLNTRDIGYLVYKRIAQFKPVVWLFGLLHPDWAMGLARLVSRHSRGAYRDTDPTKGGEIEPIRAFARKSLAEGKADVVVCGHAHSPTKETHPTPNGTGLYLNTGDWLHHRSYIEWDGREFTVRLFTSPPTP